MDNFFLMMIGLKYNELYLYSQPQQDVRPKNIYNKGKHYRNKKANEKQSSDDNQKATCPAGL